MKARRNRSKRGARNSEATTERELRRMIAALRRGLLGDTDSFEGAVRRLRQQLIARGGDGRLRDVVCHLDEDGRGALLAANWTSDEPVIAGFTLSEPTSEDEFDPDFYVRRAVAS